jgi:putative drug exporter of the RND superfamily
VVARPLIWAGIAAVALLALATPALGLRLGQPAVDAPSDLPVVQTMSEIEHAFPQAPAPAIVVVTGPDVTGPRVMAAVDALRSRTSASGPIRRPVTATSIGGGRALVVDVTLAGDGRRHPPGARDHARRARPGRRAGIRGAADGFPFGCDPGRVNRLEPAVGGGGLRAGHADLPGRPAEGLLGYTSFGAITWWIPLFMFMFVFLFGISMDYHRFSVFVTLPLVELKILGVGMAAAVLIDATVVRGVLLPATLALLGDRAWRLRRTPAPQGPSAAVTPGGTAVQSHSGQV